MIHLYRSQERCWSELSATNIGSFRNGAYPFRQQNLEMLSGTVRGQYSSEIERCLP